MATSQQRYAEQIAGSHQTAGFDVLPDEEFVHASYRDGSYDLFVNGERLTDVEGDLTKPSWLDGRRTVLALLDHDGTEQHDLIEVDPDTGSIDPILEDDHQIINPIPNPTDSDVLGFLSTSDGSIDLYTFRIGDPDSVRRRSAVDDLVNGFDWAPDGDQLVYQTRMIEGSALRVVDLDAGTDEVLIDEPGSEQALTLYFGTGEGAWTDNGIVFTTNHVTGYRELAVANAAGEFDLRYSNGRDKFDARWGPDGDVLFTEARDGNFLLRQFDGTDATTVEPSGVVSYIRVANEFTYYLRHGPETPGEIYRDSTRIFEEPFEPTTVAPEPITYESFDGMEIPARLYMPSGDPDGAVVLAHGGPEALHINWINERAQILVNAGYEVLTPDVRGSVGYGRAFRKESDGDLGGGDLRDIEAAAKYLQGRGHDAVGVAGLSYGGYMTMMAVGATDAFDAGVSVAGIVNWKTAVEKARGYLGDYTFRKFGGTPEELPELYEERSPITYVDEISVPLLVVQGANDPRVVENEADQLVESLSDRDVPFEYLLFDDEGHVILHRENRIEYLTEMVSFFDTHLRQDE